MLEQVLHQPRAGLRWRGPIVVLSFLAHAGALAAFLAAGMWRVDKLPPIESAVTFVASVGVAIPEEGPARAEAPPDRPRATRVDTHQPTDRRREPAPGPASDTPAIPGTDTTGAPSLFDACQPGGDCTPAILQGVEPPVCGNGQVEPGETCDDGGRASGDGCSATCRAEPVVVAQRAIEAQRVAGDPQIPAPDAVRAQMARARQAQVRADVKMCLGPGGDVTSARVLRSTGYPEYDARLTDRMRTWRYRPFQVNGAAVPVCSVVTFLYRFQ